MQWIELADAGAAGGGFLGSILPLVLMFAIFYFLLIRPQQKKQKQRNAMLNALKKGDKVVTIGGVHGTISEMREDTIIVKIAENTRVTMEKGAVNQVVSSDAE
ncbi:preprotein translocase subunit YajC [Ammoniphilus sp. CFH 90114]|uniref:preprotein translocase subunit YajC n=1 Tax=Ammoniphilus sp. CFH 90114 TaxID=2493665 RepID=UPI00100E1598|nr:preprotein translocase subunit YajC [Ammoniphilus sp. CFH 90114]RXT14749.1 preprotein translocase subunit YajC [Ammoniphilus sp. CFH 90114]